MVIPPIFRNGWKAIMCFEKGFTAKFRPWMVIYCEHCTDKTVTMKREKSLKNGKGRTWIHAKIETDYQSIGFISA